MVRFKLKFHVSKKQRLLFEVGMAILCMILFVGVLGSMQYISKTPILTTEDLMNAKVYIDYKNTTNGNMTSKLYKLSDIGTLYDGKLYLTIPAIEGYDAVWRVRIISNVTFGQLIDRGFNSIRYSIKFLNTSTLTSIALKIYIDHYVNETYLWHSGAYWFLDDTKINSTEFNATHTVDLGQFIIYVTGGGFRNDLVAISFSWGMTPIPVNALSGIAVSVDMYVTSQKPVFKALTEPIYPVFAGIYSALLGIIRRVKSYVLSAFSGFSVGAIFTGLIGDPLIALCVTLFAVTVFFAVYKGRR